MTLYLLAPLTAWFIAQLIKFSTEAFKGRIDFSLFWRSGGFPSSHTSIVIALVVVILMLDGFNSALFGVTAVIALVVVYDAVGVRRSVQHLIPAVIHLAENSSLEIDRALLRARGHSGTEVTFGVLNGALIGFLFTFSTWSPHLSVLTDIPSAWELNLLKVLFSVFVILGLSIFVFASRAEAKKLPTYSKLRRMSVWSFIITGGFGWLCLGAAQETISLLGWRGTLWLIVLAVVVAQIILSVKWYGKIPEHLVQEKQHFIEEKKRKKARKQKSKKRRKRK